MVVTNYLLTGMILQVGDFYGKKSAPDLCFNKHKKEKTLFKKQNISLKTKKQNTNPNVSHKKDPPTFHYTGWLIGILMMVYYNPYITG